jgi:hypothetical protein
MNRSSLPDTLCAVALTPVATSSQVTLVGVLFLLLSTVLAQGCATQRAYFGYDETDLSSLQPGVSRIAIEKVIGPPERIEQGDGVSIAWYVYDMGNIGNIEKEGIAFEIAMLPAAVFSELITFGMLGPMFEHCQKMCQKGLLEVCYDASGSMLSARESLLPETHPLLDGCLYGRAGRSGPQACKETRVQAKVYKTEGIDPDWLLDKAAGTYCPNADLGHADAQLQIGDINYYGTYGQKINSARAWVWYSLAAQGGDAQAARKLSQVTAELTPDQQEEAMTQLAGWQPGQCAQELVPDYGGQSIATRDLSDISASTCLEWQAEKEERKRRNSYRGDVSGL